MAVLQLGRLSDERFILDFSPPLSAFQAFGIALSRFDSGVIKNDK